MFRSRDDDLILCDIETINIFIYSYFIIACQSTVSIIILFVNDNIIIFIKLNKQQLPIIFKGINLIHSIPFHICTRNFAFHNIL